MFDCEKCKFYDIDYVWDDECDEEEIEICKKVTSSLAKMNVKISRDIGIENKKEEFFECDTCGNLSKCITVGNLIEITTINDTIRHFVKSSSCKCKQWEL